MSAWHTACRILSLVRCGPRPLARGRTAGRVQRQPLTLISRPNESLPPRSAPCAVEWVPPASPTDPTVRYARPSSAAPKRLPGPGALPP
eukprot:scaffold337_cov393-Prasinococcus_capsulatus_cf.AAC.1